MCTCACRIMVMSTFFYIFHEYLKCRWHQLFMAGRQPTNHSLHLSVQFYYKMSTWKLLCTAALVEPCQVTLPWRCWNHVNTDCFQEALVVYPRCCTCKLSVTGVLCLLVSCLSPDATWSGVRIRVSPKYRETRCCRSQSIKISLLKSL